MADFTQDPRLLRYESPAPSSGNALGQLRAIIGVFNVPKPTAKAVAIAQIRTLEQAKTYAQAGFHVALKEATANPVPAWIDTGVAYYKAYRASTDGTSLTDVLRLLRDANQNADAARRAYPVASSKGSGGGGRRAPAASQDLLIMEAPAEATILGLSPLMLGLFAAAAVFLIVRGQGSKGGSRGKSKGKKGKSRRRR